jgi:hypothetical protein
MPRLVVRRIATAFGALTAAFTLAAGLTTAVAAADVPPGLIDASDIQVTVSYDKPTYDSDATLTATLTVTNNSDETAEGVQAYNSSECLQFPASHWPGFSDSAGVSIAPHSSQTAQLSGAAPTHGLVNGVVTCTGYVRGTNIVGANSIPFTGTTTIVQVYGDYHGVVYVDRNKDGVFEPGEGLDGITASYSLIGASDPTAVPIVTGPDGQFSFVHVPIGKYDINFSSPTDWVVGGAGVDDNFTTVPVTRAATPTGYFPAARPLSDSLHATVRFDQSTYRPGDTVHLTVTLRNSGTSPITGVIADCNRIGDENSVYTGAVWGELAFNGPGATIPAGHTRVFHASAPLPADAQKWGYVSALCVFGPEPTQEPQIGFWA